MTSEGILLRPKKVIDATQAWFWTPEWQAGEREADQEYAAGLTSSASRSAITRAFANPLVRCPRCAP